MASARICSLIVVVAGCAALRAEPPTSPIGPPALMGRLLGEPVAATVAADPSLAVRALLRAGNLLHALGEMDRAADAYRCAITQAELFSAKFPDLAQHRLILAAACNDLGALCRTRQHWAHAEIQYLRAIKLLEDLSAGQAHSPAIRRVLANAYVNLGLLFDAQGAFSKARERYRQATAIRESLAQPLATIYSAVGDVGGGYYPASIVGWDLAARILLDQRDVTEREVMAARFVSGNRIPREDAYCVYSSLIILLGPADAVAERIGPKLWRNRFFGDAIQAEIAKAAELGVTPTPITTPASVAAIGKDGRAFKFVVTEQGELFGLPRWPGDLIKHSIVSGGRPVLCAGNARVQSANKVLLDRRSGHYRPDRESMTIAKQKFEAAGFVAEVVEGGVE